MIKETAVLSEQVLERIGRYKKKGVKIPGLENIKTEHEIDMIRKSGVVNTGVLDYVSANIKEGMTTLEIDDLVKEYTEKQHAICAPYKYEGFPKSVCTSINHEVCHGIPSKFKRLKKGDIVNVDVSTILDGYFSDASRMFIIGETTDEKRLLVERTKECLEAGLAAVKPYGTTGDIGKAIQKVADSYGYGIVRELGGHGVGIEFHEDPFIYHFQRKAQGMLMVPGMIFTIEPMINIGRPEVVVDRYNGWTIYTKDEKDSAQWEHTVLVTEDGYEILTH
jgi:methionyl aminopeptidase